MNKSSRPIIEHVPLFLNYCKEVGLSEKTQENYSRYLKKFILWLKKEKKSTLLSHDLTVSDVQAYSLYLSRYKDEKGHSLKKISQNYYLIALRALLSYFTAKDIVSLLPNKISLPRGFKREKTTNFLNLDQIEKLLEVPDTKTLIGLRDRALLAVIISSGLKVTQLKNLNRDQVEQNVPGETLVYVKEYLETRNDNNKALFIHFRSKKGVENRLIARSIERIVQKYGKKINLSFLITPEFLRWARALAILNKEIKIKETHNHQTLTIKNYKNRDFSSVDPKKIQNLSPAWHSVENLINQEVTWLKNNIPVLPGGYKENPSFLSCDECILRKIAILIVSGKVKSTELKSEDENKDLWNDLT
ncbi:MAG: phage integrase N-terminal SAM-like domain-containing protein, partial [Ignavibacteria bacterium]|nr:phage integrase N-terminal SAM-like domain-containing protein [Ignavibacteria bacterium]